MIHLATKAKKSWPQKSTSHAQTCKIMAFMNENPQHNFTRREIASYLSIETSSVAGRVNQLVNDGDLIELPIKRKCSITGITAIVLRLPLSQSDLFEVDA